MIYKMPTQPQISGVKIPPTFETVWEGTHLGGALRFMKDSQEPEPHLYFVFQIMEDELDGKILIDPSIPLSPQDIVNKAFEAVSNVYFKAVAADLQEAKKDGHIH